MNNLPPGVTDAMIEAQCSDVEVEQFVDWLSGVVFPSFLQTANEMIQALLTGWLTIGMEYVSKHPNPALNAEVEGIRQLLAQVTKEIETTRSDVTSE